MKCRKILRGSRFTVSGFILASILGFISIPSRAEAQTGCPENAHQILFDTFSQLNKNSPQSIQNGWKVANAAINQCKTDVHALVQAGDILNMIASWVKDGDEAHLVASKAIEAIWLAEALPAPEGPVPEVKRSDGSSFKLNIFRKGFVAQNAAKKLVMLDTAERSHKMFVGSSPLKTCPYQHKSGKDVESEAIGLLEGAVQRAKSPGAYMSVGYGFAKARLERLQDVCDTKVRYLYEVRAELLLRLAEGYLAEGDADIALEKIQDARRVLDLSYAMTSDGRPYSTVEKLHTEINEKLATVKADLAETQ